QMIISGEGTLGTHTLAYPGVHFARAHTPYGPIKCSEKGLGFLTLRAHRDPGAQFMPERRAALEKVADRRPWQITEIPAFGAGAPASGVSITPMKEIKDDDGLAGFSVTMQPGKRAYMPDPSRGDGQYIIVTKGSVVHEGSTKKGLTII